VPKFGAGLFSMPCSAKKSPLHAGAGGAGELFVPVNSPGVTSGLRA
jgi:hypothetical protein